MKENRTSAATSFFQRLQKQIYGKENRQRARTRNEGLSTGISKPVAITAVRPRRRAWIRAAESMERDWGKKNRSLLTNREPKLRTANRQRASSDNRG
jgi:hypothetical protein